MFERDRSDLPGIPLSTFKTGEAEHSRSDALRISFSNIVHHLGSIVRGEVVLVPLSTLGYQDQVNSLVNDTSLREDGRGWRSDAQVVHAALQAARLTVEDAPRLSVDEL
jgi:hypothetical protein